MQIKTKHDIGDVIFGLKNGKAERIEIARVCVTVRPTGEATIEYYSEGYEKVLDEKYCYDSLEELREYVFSDLEEDA